MPVVLRCFLISDQCVETHKKFNLALAVNTRLLLTVLSTVTLRPLATGAIKRSLCHRRLASLRCLTDILMRPHCHICVAATPRSVERVNLPGLDNFTTHFGVLWFVGLCPAETLEGQACALDKNLALMACISVGSIAAPVIVFLEEWGLESLEEHSHSFVPSTKIFVDGVWKGVHRDPVNLVKTLKKLCRKDDISPKYRSCEIFERRIYGCTLTQAEFSDRCSLSRINILFCRKSTFDGRIMVLMMTGRSLSGII